MVGLPAGPGDDVPCAPPVPVSPAATCQPASHPVPRQYTSSSIARNVRRLDARQLRRRLHEHSSLHFATLVFDIVPIHLCALRRTATLTERRRNPNASPASCLNGTCAPPAPPAL